MPQVLRQKPEITSKIEGIIAAQFPLRDEFARLLDEVTRLLDELKLIREDRNRHKEQVELRLELQSEEMSQLRDKMNQRFKQQQVDILDIKSDTQALKQELNQQQNDIQELKQGLSQQQNDMLDLKSDMLNLKRRMLKVESTVVKATARREDVDMFARKVKLIALQNPNKQVEGIFISPVLKKA